MSDREEQSERLEHDWRPLRMKDTGTDPPRYVWRCEVCHLDQWSSDLPDALDPDHPCTPNATGAEPVQVTDEMVERAAAALADPPDRRIDWTPHYGEFSDDVKDLYRRQARAALRAALETPS